MAKKELTIGLIGYKFMGKAHSNAYRQVNRYFELPLQVRMKTICGRNEEGVKQAASTFGWESYETDWRKVISDPEIDVIDISTPGSMHAEVCIAAAEAGKIVFCEKPIGNTLGEAAAMAIAVEKSGKPSLVFHNYRACPAVALAKRMISDGKLGEIHHIRSVYLQDWIADPQFPLVWRLTKEVAGSGSLGDIGSHMIDLARYLIGEFTEVNGFLHTFVKERPLAGEADDRMGATSTGEMGRVDVDDAALFLAKFESGAIGTFEATRFAVGRKNHNRFEINGSKGSLVFNLERMNELDYFNGSDPSGEQGFRLIQVTESDHPYTGQYWPPGHIIGYEHTFINLLASAIEDIAIGQSPRPNMEDGLRNQQVLHAVELSSHDGSWVKV